MDSSVKVFKATSYPKILVIEAFREGYFSSHALCFTSFTMKTLCTFQSAVNLRKIKQSCILDASGCLPTVIEKYTQLFRKKTPKRH